MGSERRKIETLKGIGVHELDIEDLVKATELLESAGDGFSDILYFWANPKSVGEQVSGGLLLSKDQVVDALREHILKLQKAIDRISISR
jgi:hypothetical protein